MEEGRALIPFYAPEWTDHNIHDPGITIMELFAWVAEMDIYQLNQIPEEHRRKFLALIGLRPLPPRPARTVLSFTLQNGVAPFSLPASVEFEGKDLSDQPTHARTLDALTLISSQIEAVQVKDQNGLHDLTARWRRSEQINLFGNDPAPGATLYLGFSRRLPVGRPVSLFFSVGDFAAMLEERARLIEEQKRAQAECRPSDSTLICGTGEQPATLRRKRREISSHHSVRIVWEYQTRRGNWRALDEAAGEVVDETRSFTFNGRVILKVPRMMLAQPLGSLKQNLYYLRCRLAAGAYDAAPVLRTLALNAVMAEQATPIGTQLKIAEGTQVEGPDPQAGQRSGFLLQFNKQDEISHIQFIKQRRDVPSFRILRYEQPTVSDKGSLSFEATLLTPGSGEPWQQRTLPQSPVIASSLRLFTLEGDRWQAWSLKSDLDASDREASDFLLDATDDIVTFGNGERGRVPPKNALIVAAYRTTRAERGNLDQETIKSLTDNLHNRAVVKRFDEVNAQLAAVTNTLPATGGTAAETLAQVSVRALELMQSPTRAVTLADYEALAVRTPGARLARVSARANLYPGFPCYKATGIVTVIILPHLPTAQPLPSAGLRRAVASYLTSRRVIGTRVEVIGPTYLEVTVRAQVKACPRTDKSRLQSRVIDALNRFFHPLAGGPQGTGWPFGRDVYRSEVLQTIDETPGVDNVLSLELIAGTRSPQCGNICLGPTGLVAVGPHQIEIM
ncbi:MAG: putative baseplate assembly protein [Pyrinomonadaceae bacterium]